MSAEVSPSGQDSGAGGPKGPLPALRASHADRDRVVDVLRIAAGDGLLTSEELDERVEAALSARTVDELGPLTADLPGSAAPARAGGDDTARIERRFSTVTREGRWPVPRRMELDTEWSAVTLDFTEAVITHDTLVIDVDMQGKTLTLITPPGVVVNTDDLALEHARLRVRRTPDAGERVVLRVELVGTKRFGRVLVRPPRRRRRR
ncbi:hypothetical protein SRB5_25370 [Streptomyces sp. RB5]|uniref:DUF1707 domain-containing protein n=1 Tax=Streptomyces smaragdinus TaxID=2585196 RepID=A0A7K0CI45_9ACTN|nr:DUF1707 domain-containing protein [Streptomyces smaragdinus]MQY12404.1 hypothetical protein [Streptomyces smaragdinus]